MNYADTVLKLLGEHSLLLYPLLFVLALVEGPITMLFSGFLVRLGYFDYRLVYPALLLGDLAGDFVWYAIGYYGAKKTIARVGKFFSLDMSVVPRIEALFAQHQKKIIFISKMTMGLGFAVVTLMSAGLARVSLKNFGWFNFLGGLFFTAMVMAIGFSLGQAYTLAGRGFDLLSLAAGTIIFLLLLAGFGRYMRSLISKNKIR